MGTITIKNLIGGNINIITTGGGDEPEERYMGPLCFTAQEDKATVGMVGPLDWDTEEATDVTVSLQISKDGQKTWTPWDGRVVDINSECENGKLYVKALNPNENGFFDEDFWEGHKFVINKGKVAASGNIQYLLDPTGERMDVPEYCYNSMFSDCTSLTQSPDLPATSLAESCYYGMFWDCTSLTQAPELPAATLAQYCYFQMFSGCTSLTSAPELPATTLATSCYQFMFSSCTSLTQAPELPATTLTSYCYSQMFSSCTSLTSAPELPATILASNCYNQMFRKCTSLTQAPELPATTLASGCYFDMFNGCTNIDSVTMKNAVNPYDSTTYGYLKRGGSQPNYTDLNITYVD